MEKLIKLVKYEVRKKSKKIFILNDFLWCRKSLKSALKYNKVYSTKKQ